MDGSSESIPKRLQGQKRPAKYWLCAGAPSNGNWGKLPIESPHARERRWIVLFLRQYAFPLVLCCAGAALFLAWYIPYLFPGWHAAATRWLDAHRLFAIVLSIILLIFLLFWLLLWKLPQWQVAAVPEVKDRIDLESKSRQTLVQIVGGAAALGALYFTAQTLRTSQETLRVNQKTLETTQQGQITERFSKAIEQLGSDNLAIRLGGIYALERIARDSAYDHWTVMEVLTAYVRENAPWPPKDMQQQQGDPLSKGEPPAAQSQQLPPQPKRGTFNGSGSSVGAQQIAEDFILSSDATIKAISWPGIVINVDPSSVPSSIEFIVRFFQDEGIPPLQPLQLNHRPML